MNIRTSIIALVIPCTLWGQIPIKPNETDNNNQKQGDWIYYFNDDWDLTNNVKEAEFYRLVTYKNGVPIGQVTDFFLSGNIQMSIDSLISEDPERAHGKVLSYSEEGNVTYLEFYDSGELDTLRTIETFKFFIDKYNKEIPDHLDVSFLANDLAYWFLVQERWSDAIPYYSKALEIRQKQLGNDHILCARSSNKLGYVNMKLGDLERALSLYEESARLFLQLEGESEGYQNSRYHITKVHAMSGDWNRALQSYMETNKLTDRELNRDDLLWFTEYIEK